MRDQAEQRGSDIFNLTMYRLQADSPSSPLPHTIPYHVIEKLDMIQLRIGVQVISFLGETSKPLAVCMLGESKEKGNDRYP